MKKHSLLLFALIFLLSSYDLAAQSNVIKLEPFPLFQKRLALSYERVLSPNVSVQLGLDYQFNKKFSLLGFDFEDDEFDYDFAINWKGYRITPEVRLYTGAVKEAPEGFYFAPYLRFNRFKLDAFNSIPINGEQRTERLDGTIRQIGGGIAIGYQWIISEKVSIDWTFFGLGGYSTSVKLLFEGTAFDPQDFKEIHDDALVLLEDVPFIKVTDSNYDNKSTDVTVRTFLPGLRFNVRVGFAF